METTIVTGVDLVYIPRFKETVRNGGQSFFKRVFHEEELKNQDTVHLAGIFAAKEAIIKTLGLPVDSFHDIKVTNSPKGAPRAEVTNYQLPITHCSLSISHDRDYVVAQFVAIVKKNQEA